MTRGAFLRLAALLATSAGCRPRARPVESTKQLPLTSVPPGVQLAPAWDFNGVLGTGQSLAVGSEGTPLRLTRPAYHNLKLDLGARVWPGQRLDDARVSLVPLCEPIRPLGSGYPSPYPRNIFGETPHSAMASQVTASFLEATSGAGDYVTVHSVVGESGQGLHVIGKHAERTRYTGYAYEASLFEARALTQLLRAAGRSFGIAAILLTHGETDAHNTRYAEDLLQLAREYDADLRAITGQSRNIPLLATQQCSCPGDERSLALSAQALLSASERAPERIVCVGPKYQYSYVRDGVHLDALGYDQLGEKYGQVYFERVVLGRDFQPLAPRSIKRSGNVIDVEFHVPVPPLRLNERFEPQPAARPEWAKGRGFELSAGTTPVVIEEVTLSASSVRIRHVDHADRPLLLRYAMSAVRQPRAGGSFRGGALCDSDPFVGAVTRLPQPNYAVMFERELG